MRLVRSYLAIAVCVLLIEAQVHAEPDNFADSGVRIVDLTHPFDAETIYWPTEPGFELIRVKYGIADKGYFYAANRFKAAEHGGTHVDAPIHFFQGGVTVDKIDFGRLVGEAVVVDVSSQCAQNPDYLIGVNDLRAWEREHGRQLIDVIVMLHTGYGARWRDRKQYLGTDRRGREAVADLHFPGLSPEAAKWLTEHRSVRSIGIDTASIDYGQSTLFESHVTLFAQGIPAFENVAHLDQLPSEGARVHAMPMKIAGGSGGPLRIIATIGSGQAP